MPLKVREEGREGGREGGREVGSGVNDAGVSLPPVPSTSP